MKISDIRINEAKTILLLLNKVNFSDPEDAAKIRGWMERKKPFETRPGEMFQIIVFRAAEGKPIPSNCLYCKTPLGPEDQVLCPTCVKKMRYIASGRYQKKLELAAAQKPGEVSKSSTADLNVREITRDDSKKAFRETISRAELRSRISFEEAEAEALRIAEEAEREEAEREEAERKAREEAEREEAERKAREEAEREEAERKAREEAEREEAERKAREEAEREEAERKAREEEERKAREEAEREEAERKAREEAEREEAERKAREEAEREEAERKAREEAEREEAERKAREEAEREEAERKKAEEAVITPSEPYSPQDAKVISFTDFRTAADKASQKNPKKIVAIVAAVLLIVAIAVMIWLNYFDKPEVATTAATVDIISLMGKDIDEAQAIIGAPVSKTSDFDTYYSDYGMSIHTNEDYVINSIGCDNTASGSYSNLLGVYCRDMRESAYNKLNALGIVIANPDASSWSIDYQVGEKLYLLTFSFGDDHVILTKCEEKA